MVSRALITQAQANAMTVDAQEPLAEDVNQIYELFGKINTGLNTPVDEGDLLTANELNAVACLLYTSTYRSWCWPPYRHLGFFSADTLS